MVNHGLSRASGGQTRARYAGYDPSLSYGIVEQHTADLCLHRLFASAIVDHVSNAEYITQADWHSCS